jgi:hypothetical protein
MGTIHKERIYLSNSISLFYTNAYQTKQIIDQLSN